jgi:hypothetical protein
VFFSLTELRFAQALCRRGQPSERRKYIRLVNDGSCRVLPSAKQTAVQAAAMGASARGVVFRHPSSNHSTLRATGRSSAEKPYKLVGMRSGTLEYFVRTVYNTTPVEHGGNSDLHSLGTHEDSVRRSAEFIAPFLQKAIATVDGGVLSNTPQLLRHLRKWMRLCKEQCQMRKLAERVRRRRSSVVLREVYDLWTQAFQWEREVNRLNKVRTFALLRAEVSRGQVLRRANGKTRQGVTHRHWQRFVAAHIHQTELRRLHGGHFYNSVLNGSSRRVLTFIANHTSVPFSVRHFLSSFPSYRFPIYKRYEAAYWEHSSQSAAYQALQVLCQHYRVYGHEHHLQHHLELFQHHHEELLGAGGEFGRGQGTDRDGYTTPASRKTNAAVSAKPLHLLPGAMLSDQAFSVRAAIGSRYRRGAEEGPGSAVRSGSISPQKGRLVQPKDGGLSPRPGSGKLSLRPPASIPQHAGEPPAAVQLAGAAVFMAHWISECLLQYYALRRGFLLLRKYTHRRLRRSTLLRHAFLVKEKAAFAALWLNRRDSVVTKQLQRRRLRTFSHKMRVCVVAVRCRRGLLRKVLQLMSHTYRYRLIVRTWENAWRIRARSAWDRLVTFASRRDKLVTQCKQVLHSRLQRDTVRTMCTVTTANLWRRRRSRVLGLSAFVVHYNRSVQAMDREELVRMYATTKHYTALRENLLGLLKQRLSSVVGMAYRTKMAQIRGFLAIAANVRQPQRQFREAALRDRVHHALYVLRRNHAAYKDHSFRSYGDSEWDGRVLNTFNSFRERQLLKTGSRYQQEFGERGILSPYVSDTLPLPSPLPPSHTLDTPVRRASMLRPPASPARISHDALSEAPPPLEPSDLSPESRARSLVASPSVASFRSRSSRTARPSDPLSSSSAAQLFGSASNSVRSHRKSAVSPVRTSLYVRSGENPPPATSSEGVGERSSTLSAMAERRRSTHVLRQQQPSLRSASADDNDSLDSADVELVSVASFVSRGPRGALGGSRSTASPYLPRGRRASTGSAPEGVAPSLNSLGRRSSASAQESFYTGGSSSVSTRSTRLSRRASLHDAHDAMLSAPTSLPAPPTPGATSEASLSMTQSLPRGPSSILITSPAYTGAPRSVTRRDSRINFHDSVHDLYGSGSGGAAGLRRSASSRSRASESGDAGGAESLQPFSPLTQHSDDGAPGGRGSYFFDDNSTEVSTLRDTDSARGGYPRLLRRKSSAHIMRTEETAEQMLVLERAMQRGLWRRWRRELIFRKQMRVFCMNYEAQRMLRTGLQLMRQQTSIDRFQRRQLQYIDKRRAFALLQQRATDNDERRQVGDFADKYFVVMAMKLTLRRWRSRANKSAATTGRYKRAAAFSSKRRCTLFLLSLRASCVSLTASEVTVLSSPERQARVLRTTAKRGAGSGGKGVGTEESTSVRRSAGRRAVLGAAEEQRSSQELSTPLQSQRGRSNAAATLTAGAISALLSGTR